MSRMHGKECRAYLGGRDASADITSIEPKGSVSTHDVTNLASAGWVESDAGGASWDASVEAFYDPVAAGVGRQFEDLLGAAGGIVSIFDGDANSIGDAGILLSDAILTERGQPINVGEMVKLTGALTPAAGTSSSGRPGFNGRLLHPKSSETETGTEASLDNTTSSASGGRASLHITTVTGTWTIKVQHSANNTDWTDLASFASKTAIGGHTIEVSGTVNRYLRASHTEDVAGSVEYVLGFARY